MVRLQLRHVDVCFYTPRKLGAGGALGNAHLLFFHGAILGVRNIADTRARDKLVFPGYIGGSIPNHPFEYSKARSLGRILCLCHSRASRIAAPMARLYGAPP